MRGQIRVLIFCLLVPIYGCDEAPPVQVGFIGGLEGRASDIGIASRNALQLAVEEVNTAGGINGRKIQLLIRDDTATAEGGAAAAEDLIKEGVSAIIGPNLSSVAAGVVPVINEAKMVTISPTVASYIFAGKDDYFYRINSTTRQLSKLYSEHYFRNGYKRIALAIDASNAASSNSWLKEFQTSFEALGGEILVTTQYNVTESVSSSETVSRLLNTNPDGIMLIGSGVVVAKLSNNIRKNNNDIKLISAGAAASESLVKLGGKAVEGLELVQTFNRDNKNEHFIRFKKSYKDRFRESPGYSSVAAYDAATMLFAAMRIRKEDQTLKEAMGALQPQAGLQQDLLFDEFGDSTRRAFFVIIKNGKYVQQ